MSALPEATMLLFSALTGILNPLPQPGDAGFKQIPENAFRLVYENDATFDTDCNYTHGTRFDYAQMLCQREEAPIYWGISLDQTIYTPETHADGNVWNEHPYAGNMAFGMAALFQGRRIGTALELQIGAMGRASISQHTQNGFHDLGHMVRWDGWDDQVPSEMTLQFTQRIDIDLPMARTHLAGLETDGLAFTRYGVGNVQISGALGMSFRIGTNLPDSMAANGKHPAGFGVGLITKPEYDRTRPSYFLQGSFEVDYVARDFSIDGGMFHHFDQTCSRKPFQVEAVGGLGISYQGIDYFGGVLYHSHTYRTQRLGGLMGTFSISMRW